MPDSNYDYWREREEEQRRHNLEDLNEYNARLTDIYQRMIDEATKEIESFYGKYASAEGITIQEAKKRIASADIEKYKRKAEEYVKTHDFTNKANAEMRLYNATMKINRLELLKAQIGLYMCGGVPLFYGSVDNVRGANLASCLRQRWAHDPYGFV